MQCDLYIRFVFVFLTPFHRGWPRSPFSIPMRMPQKKNEVVKSIFSNEGKLTDWIIHFHSALHTDGAWYRVFDQLVDRLWGGGGEEAFFDQ